MDIGDLQRQALALEDDLAAVIPVLVSALNGQDWSREEGRLHDLISKGGEIVHRLELVRMRLAEPRMVADTLAGATLSPAEAARRLKGQTYFRGLGRRLGIWQRAVGAMRAFQRGDTWPLYCSYGPESAFIAEQVAALDAAFVAMHRLANPNFQNAGAEEHGCFSDIPLRPSNFVAHAHAATRVAIAQCRPRPLRFLDVGCGGGVKVLQAAEFFEICHGLEYDPGYAASSAAMFERLGIPGCSTFQADGLTFEGYGEYDVIYFFQPMRVPELLLKLEAQIIQVAREGTILIAPYSSFDPSVHARPCARIDGQVFVVGLDEEKAAALKARAERTGINIYDPRQPIGPEAQYLTPLVSACLANGFAL